MPILVSKSFENWSHSDIEAGETHDTGFKFTDEPHTFHELVKLMREHRNPSSWPATGGEYEWYSSDEDDDFITGEQRYTSIHFSRENEPRALKYWRWAAIAAGIVKEKK